MRSSIIYFTRGYVLEILLEVGLQRHELQQPQRKLAYKYKFPDDYTVSHPNVTKLTMSQTVRVDSSDSFHNEYVYMLDCLKNFHISCARGFSNNRLNGIIPPEYAALDYIQNLYVL